VLLRFCLISSSLLPARRPHHPFKQSLSLSPLSVCMWL
jgi:hypothetical protein